MEKTTMNETFICSPISFAGLVLVLIIILNWLIILQLHSNSRYAFVHLFLAFLCDVIQIHVWSDSESSNTIQTSCIEYKSDDDHDQPHPRVPISEQEISEVGENVAKDKKWLCIGEVGRMMEKLGRLVEAGTKETVVDLFEEEPSLEEVKEAFDVFDENKDGFIDAGEVRKVVCALGFVQASELECNRMIKAFDCNGDGLIDFEEFVKLMENSFSC